MEAIFFFEEFYLYLAGLFSSVFAAFYGGLSTGLGTAATGLIQLGIIAQGGFALRNGMGGQARQMLLTLSILTIANGLAAYPNQAKEYVYDTLVHLPAGFSEWILTVQKTPMDPVVMSGTSTVKKKSPCVSVKGVGCLFARMTISLWEIGRSQLGFMGNGFLEMGFIVITMACVIVLYIIYGLINLVFLVQINIYMFLFYIVLLLSAFSSTRHVIYAWARGVFTAMLLPILSVLIMSIFYGKVLELFDAINKHAINRVDGVPAETGEVLLMAVFAAAMLSQVSAVSSALTGGMGGAVGGPLDVAGKTWDALKTVATKGLSKAYQLGSKVMNSGQALGSGSGGSMAGLAGSGSQKQSARRPPPVMLKRATPQEASMQQQQRQRDEAAQIRLASKRLGAQKRLPPPPPPEAAMEGGVKPLPRAPQSGMVINARYERIS